MRFFFVNLKLTPNASYQCCRSFRSIFCDFNPRKYHHSQALFPTFNLCRLFPGRLRIKILSILSLKLSLKSASPSCVVVKISGNEPSLSAMQKKAPDEDVKYSVFKIRGRITQVFGIVPGCLMDGRVFFNKLN